MPHIPVIYFVVKQPDLVLYIGQSKNLYNRFQRHDQLKNFRRHYDEFEEVENHPKVFYLDCSGLLAYQMNKEFITNTIILEN